MNRGANNESIFGLNGNYAAAGNEAQGFGAERSCLELQQYMERLLQSRGITPTSGMLEQLQTLPSYQNIKQQFQQLQSNSRKRSREEDEEDQSQQSEYYVEHNAQDHHSTMQQSGQPLRQPGNHYDNAPVHLNNGNISPPLMQNQSHFKQDDITIGTGFSQPQRQSPPQIPLSAFESQQDGGYIVITNNPETIEHLTENRYFNELINSLIREINYNNDKRTAQIPEFDYDESL